MLCLYLTNAIYKSAENLIEKVNNYLEIGELAKRLVTNVTLVVHFAVLLLQRVGK